MSKLIIFILAICCSQLPAQTIDDGLGSAPVEKPKFEFSDIADRCYFGGGLGAQFGSNTFINVSPLLGVKLTDRFSVGTQLIYNYVDLNYGNYRYHDHIVGYSVFGRAFVYEGLFLTSSYEVINGRFDVSGKRINVPSWFVGGGYLYRLSDNFGISMTIVYNLTPSIYTPYSNPMVNVGMSYGW